MFRVIVAGSRNIDDEEYIFSKLDYLLQNRSKDKIEIISGGARGVDTLAVDYAKSRNIKFTVFPANWNSFGKKAGYLRNQEMARNADALVAFWDGESRGTKHMMDIAKDENLMIRAYKLRK